MKYNVTYIALYQFLIASILYNIVLIIILRFFLKINLKTDLNYLLVLVFYTFSYITLYRFFSGKICVYVNNEAIEFSWIKKPFLTNFKEEKIKISEINNSKHSSGRMSDRFSIKTDDTVRKKLYLNNFSNYSENYNFIKTIKSILSAHAVNDK